MKCSYINCNKKINLTSIKCKCEKIFCSYHRYPEQHNCDFNYKDEMSKKLKDLNPKITNKKVEFF